MNKMANCSSMKEVCSFCASPMQVSFNKLSVGPSDVVTKQVRATQGFPLTNNPHFNTYNHGWKNCSKFS